MPDFPASWILSIIAGLVVASVGEGPVFGQQTAEKIRDGGAPAVRQATSARATAYAAARSRAVRPGDDITLRPTVVVRQGTSQGSGTIIASVDGEALVLTAAHVVRADGPIFVEFHRYNFGREKTKAMPGAWPRPVAATLAAADSAADLAILRLKDLNALPYVARLASERTHPAPDCEVISVGIDLGTKLTTWTTRVVETAWFELGENDEERPFLITIHTPEHGRSGGGLFLTGGELVGVCVGHAPLVKGRRMGVFASAQSIRGLLADHDLKGVLVRSEKRQGLAGDRGHAPRTVGNPTLTKDVVTPTRSITGKVKLPESDEH